MDLKYKISIIFLIVIFFSEIIILLILSPSPSLSPEEKEPCNILEKNSDKGINFVFFSTKEIASKYKEYFNTFSPFSKYSESFNFYYIDTFKPECEIYKNTALL